MNINTQTIPEESIYRTADLALAAVIFMSFPFEAIDHKPNSRKAFFLFKRQEGLDTLIENYWKGELRVEPQSYFNALRAIKTRLYENQC